MVESRKGVAVNRFVAGRQHRARLRTRLDRCGLTPVLLDAYISRTAGRMAEWLCNGLQIRVQRFDSASGLQHRQPLRTPKQPSLWCGGYRAGADIGGVALVPGETLLDPSRDRPFAGTGRSSLLGTIGR